MYHSTLAQSGTSDSHQLKYVITANQCLLETTNVLLVMAVDTIVAVSVHMLYLIEKMLMNTYVYIHC